MNSAHQDVRACITAAAHGDHHLVAQLFADVTPDNIGENLTAATEIAARLATQADIFDFVGDNISQLVGTYEGAITGTGRAAGQLHVILATEVVAQAATGTAPNTDNFDYTAKRSILAATIVIAARLATHLGPQTWELDRLDCLNPR